MRLLIITQAVDIDNPALGFFHTWIEACAKKCERVEVICLFEGRHTLPLNVRVHSLGKERYTLHDTRYTLHVIQHLLHTLIYVWRFLTCIFKEKEHYDAVFVHMNPEYVVLGGPFWKLMGKPVCLWRNHYQKSWLVPVAAFFCKKVFSTSRHSYAARLSRAMIMPVGVDLARFPIGSAPRNTGSILFLARMSPSKRPHLLIEALGFLKERNIPFEATCVGDARAEDTAYYTSLKERAAALAITPRVTFLPAVPNRDTPALYARHDVFVNASPSGMYDKTIFEAMASGALVVAANKDLKELIDPRFIFEEEDVESLARALAFASALSPEEKNRFRLAHRTIAEAHSLETLVPKILAVYQEA